MNVKNIVVGACILSSAVPSFAGQEASNSGALESLQQAAAGANPDAMYDNAALKESASSKGAVSASTLDNRSQLVSPGVITVSDKGSNEIGGAKNRTKSERARDRVLKPATDLMESRYPIVRIGGAILGFLLLIPALIAGLFS